MEEIKDILNNISNDIYTKLIILYNDKINQIEKNYNDKIYEIEKNYNDNLDLFKYNFEKDLKKIENDASTFKNFGLIRNLTNENNELNRKNNLLLKEVETCKIKYNNLLFEYSKLLNTNKENEILNNQISNEKEDENLNNQISNEKEDENLNNQISNEKDEKVDNQISNKEDEIEQLSEMKKIKIKGNSFYLSNKLVNNTYKFYDSNNIEVGYKNSSGKFYFNKL
jgi:hypothetical protein